MVFNSIDFALFLPIVFVLYWFVTSSHLKLQNFLLLSSSYLFYGWWDWRFLSLILASTIIDYFVSLELEKTEERRKRKTLLWISLSFNLGLLAVFKYYNFFIDNFVAAFSFLGMEIPAHSLDIILPVGISFYTFQTLSYTIDIYKKKLSPATDFIAFAAFVSFFPQLVAGPIERAVNLLPQFEQKRFFDYEKAMDGMRQILWGLFKKVVIADNCAEYADLLFNQPDQYNGGALILGAVFFTFQIYGDFSGYSDIAIGTARLFGFNLMRNFAFPYFSRDIAEFWRRWHISLSTWFRDYLYIPLGGSRGSLYTKIRNIFIIFLVSGFWHGANWTFIFWGLLNAIYFLPLLLTKNNRKNLNIVAEHKILPSLRDILNIGITFGLTVFAWIFFRAESLTAAFHYVQCIFNGPVLPLSFIKDIKVIDLLILSIHLLFFIIAEWIQRSKMHALEISRSKVQHIILYLALASSIVLFGGWSEGFIYFQF